PQCERAVLSMPFYLATRPRAAIEVDGQRTILCAQAKVPASAGHTNRPVLGFRLNLTGHPPEGGRSVQAVSVNGAGEVTDTYRPILRTEIEHCSVWRANDQKSDPIFLIRALNCYPPIANKQFESFEYRLCVGGCGAGSDEASPYRVFIAVPTLHMDSTVLGRLNSQG